MGKIKKHEQKIYLMVDDKVLDKIKMMIGTTEKFDDTKILIEPDYKLLDDLALKNIVILSRCVTKDDDKFYLEILVSQYHK